MDKKTIIDQIVLLEWKMLISVMTLDDPDGCRENPDTFQIMRRSQHLIWNEETLLSYLADLEFAEQKGINLIAERYAYMMSVTSPQEFETLKANLSPVDAKVRPLVEDIVKVFLVWNEELDRKYRKVRASGRPVSDDSSWTSIATYLGGELLTYSCKTLTLCLQDVRSAQSEGKNLGEAILENTARFYGFNSLTEMDRYLAEHS